MPSVPPTTTPSHSSQMLPPVAPRNGASASRAPSTSQSSHQLDSRNVGLENETIYVQIIGKGKPYIKGQVWKNWTEYWKTPEAIWKSEIFSKNHQSKKGGEGSSLSLHIGGSISAFEHQQCIADGTGKEPTLGELFVHLYTNKRDGNNNWVHKRSNGIFETLQKRIKESASAHIEGSEQNIVDRTQIFLEVTGDSNKRHVYGIGSQASSYYYGMLSSRMFVAFTFETSELSQTQAKQIASLEQEFKEQKEMIERELKKQNDMILSLVDICK
ncbi:hypothetical protein JCGZ_22843 [Jatropha curcas]|uniref:Uncharacterized protein n=1 Tax=Jatropha curcas TaxID=180498 RepID=A0A067JSZ5_JATCU|nr:hypothetical protein JCGZ_22843 [Jatropha curcas]